MDWITPLRSQQVDFIRRLKQAQPSLLCCDREGLHSELTVVDGANLKRMRDFCWHMADKYKHNASVRKLFINNMQGKMAEEVVKSRLAGIVTEVDYEKRRGGDGQVDFRMIAAANIGIQVKSSQCWSNNFIDRVRWSINESEIQKNVVLVCILIKGKLEDDHSNSYPLILAGFIPTNMIIVKAGKALIGIDELLYSGALRSYLEGLAPTVTQSNQNHKQVVLKPVRQINLEPIVNTEIDYISLAKDCYQKQEYLEAIANYNKATQLSSKDYYLRGLAYLAIKDKKNAIADFNQALARDKNFAPAYFNRGLIHVDLENHQAAIIDFSGAIDNNPNYLAAYLHRGEILAAVGDKQSAIADFQKAAALFQQQNRQAEYKDMLDKITKI